MTTTDAAAIEPVGCSNCELPVKNAMAAGTVRAAFVEVNEAANRKSFQAKRNTRIAAVTTPAVGVDLDGDALGIVETATAATAIVAADVGVQAAAVGLPALRLSDDLGGKGDCLFAGIVADVEAAVEAAVAATERGRLPVRATVISQLHPEMRHNLAAELRFNERLREA